MGEREVYVRKQRFIRCGFKEGKIEHKNCDLECWKGLLEWRQGLRL